MGLVPRTYKSVPRSRVTPRSDLMVPRIIGSVLRSDEGIPRSRRTPRSDLVVPRNYLFGPRIT
jgi:hypothetical protein